MIIFQFVYVWRAAVAHVSFWEKKKNGKLWCSVFLIPEVLCISQILLHISFKLCYNNFVCIGIFKLFTSQRINICMN